MNNKKIIQELLHYLTLEREKIEYSGHGIAGIDPDLQKVYHLINEEIQDLQKEYFESEYQHIKDNLSELFEDTHQIDKKGKDNVF
jgi:hypothetical protein